MTNNEIKIINRDLSYDIVKFISIFMVIYWHVMSYRKGFDLKTMPSYVANFIIMVNMPLFFMISGFFSRRLHNSRDWHRLFNRMKFYYWPMAVFSFGFAIVDCIVL